MNQVSIVALDVPVLPAAEMPALRIDGAWPRVTTWRSRVDVRWAVRGAITGSTCVPRQRDQPIEPLRRRPERIAGRAVVLDGDAVAVADAANVDRIDDARRSSRTPRTPGSARRCACTTRPAPAPDRG
jgi:hypothetical protein